VTPSYAALFRNHGALMVAALGATFLGSLDALMVTTALPTAAQDIGGVGLIAVTVGAYTVAVAMTFPVAGAVIDREGVARSFAFACALFAIANVIGGLAPTMPVVALSRLILGFGAGFMFAVPLGLFAVSIPDALRPRAFGINAAMWGVSALIGPLLGAVLTATAGWRWVFWINLPMIAAVACAGALSLRGRPRPEPDDRGQPFNLVGPVLLGAIVAVLLAVTRKWLPAVYLAPLAAVPAVLFVWYERRSAAPVFTHTANSIAANVAAFGAGVAFLGAETYLPLQLQVGFAHGIDLPGYTLSGVRLVGVALLLCTLGWTAGSMGAARVNSLPRNQILLGSAMTFGATAVMALPSGGASVPMVAYAFSGLGMGIASPALFAAVLADGGEGREGRSTSSIPLTRQVGSGTGAAVAGIVFAATLTAHQIRAAEHAGAHVPAVVHAVRLTYLAVAAVSAVGVVACLWLRPDVEAPERSRSRPGADVADFPPDGGTEPAVRGTG
jgi:MFS family permease